MKADSLIGLPVLAMALWIAPAGARAADPATPGSTIPIVVQDVRVIADVPYYTGKDADPIKHKLDLYLPKGQKDFPVLFFVHGGTWKSGDRKRYEKLGDL